MKVLVAHNFHRSGSASGDDQVFLNETRLLEEHGIDVVPFTVSNDVFDSGGPLKKLSYACGMLWSTENYRKMGEALKRERPDIVHVHNLFPIMSPSVLYAAKENGCKVVATLHDTRLVCPAATSLCKGRLCNRCGDGKYTRMVANACYKNSAAKSLLLACTMGYHRLRRTFYSKIDSYIALNDYQKKLYVQAGFDEGKIYKKYNFVSDITLPDNTLPELPDEYVVFSGRLGTEKGIQVLMKAWDCLERGDNKSLVIVGGGPREEEVREWASTHPKVTVLGYLPHEESLAVVAGAKFLVFPSIWYEGCSMVMVETMCLGKAMIASDLGFMSEAIHDGVNGLKFRPGDYGELARLISYLWVNPDVVRGMAKAARTEYEREFSPRQNVRKLVHIYEQTLAKGSVSV